MYRTNRSITARAVRITAGLLLGSSFSGTAFGAEPGIAPAGSSRERQLELQVRELTDRVKSLEATRASADDDPASAASTRDSIEHVQDDAGRRSNPVPIYAATSSGFTAGYDKGFFLQSDDGNFLLKPAVQFQFRNISNYEQDARHDGDDDSFQNGFELRRARFRFDGNAFSPKFTYSFVWDTNRAGGAVALLDAWGQYAFADNWAVKFGQFKESVFHERDVSGFQQLAVDRSLNDALLGGTLTDRVQGVSLIHGGTKTDDFRVELAYHDGANSRNTDFRDGTTNWGAGLRGEYKLFGDWAAYKDFTAKNSKDNLLVVGGGADYTDRDGAGVLLTTADVQYEAADKFIVYGAFHGNFTDTHEYAAGARRFDWGALGQVGYLLTKQWEIFGRYDVVFLDDDAVAAGSEDTFHEITGGVNYYLGKDGAYFQKAKLSLDLTYLPNGAPSDQTQAGILAAEEDELVLRAQFQLLL